MEYLLGGFSLVNKQPLLIYHCSAAALTREFSSCSKQKLVCMHRCVCVRVCACACVVFPRRKITVACLVNVPSNATLFLRHLIKNNKKTSEPSGRYIS